MAFPTTSNNLATNHAAGQTITHGDINDIATDVNQLTLKVGTGASTPPGGNQVLTSTASGVTSWQVPVGAGSSEVQGSDFKATGLSGATAASRYVGATASGSPTTGTFALGDWSTDQTGKRWTCTVAGTPGTWAQEPGTGGSGGTSGVAVENQGGASLGTATTLNFTGAGVSTTFSAGVGTVSISGAGAGSQTVWSYNVLDYGFTNGADCTSALNTLLNTTIGTKKAIVVFPPNNNFTIDSVTLSATADVIFWNYGCTLTHKANASGHMLIGAGPLSSAPNRLTIFGGTLDGNYTNQTTTRNRTLVSAWFQEGATFRDVTFTHWSRHALEVIEAKQNVVVDNCRFLDGGEWSNTATGSGPGNDNTAVTLNNQANRYNAVFTHCQFMQTTVTTAGANPGGINIAGATDNSQPLMVTVQDCYFKNFGLRSSVGGNSTSAQTANVYFYRVGDGSKIIGNTIENPYFTGIAVTASADVEVANNTIWANNLLSASGGGYGMSVQGDDHQTTITSNGPNVVHRVTFHDNILTYRAVGGGGTGAPATQAFFLDSIQPGTGTITADHRVSEINIHDNHVDSFARGVEMSWSQGSVSIHHNTFRGLTDQGIAIANVLAGHLEVSNNKFLSTSGAPVNFLINQSYSSLETSVIGNYFENTSGGLILMGNRVRLADNIWTGTPASAPIATIGQSLGVTSVGIVTGNLSTLTTPITHTSTTTYIQANNQGTW